MNKVNLIGRLTKTPDLKHTNSGTAVTSFVLAVDGYNNKADFPTCVAWKNTAELICRYFTKGQKIGVTGRISTRPYEKGDVKLTIAEVTVESVDFCESKGKTSDNSADDFEDLDDTEELPF